ncbi:MAG: hypothetical protein KDK76_07465 [Chlamydiia bacterium]|nr:hypothetical protein [Chlamydiia bacterium]
MELVRDKLMFEIENSFLIAEYSKKPAEMQKLGAKIEDLRGTLLTHQDAFQEVINQYDQRYLGLISKEAPNPTRQTPKPAPKPKPQQVQPPSPLIVGTINQKANAKGYGETCSGTAVAFLAKTLTENRPTINGQFIDDVVREGNEAYDAIYSRKQAYMKTVSGIDEESAASRQLAAMDIQEAFADRLSPGKSPGMVEVKNSAELTNALRSGVNQLLADGHKFFGMTLTLNGKTYALTVDARGREPQFIFFDSHGTGESLGNAFALQTTNREALFRKIGETAEFVNHTIDSNLAAILSKDELTQLQENYDKESRHNRLGAYVVIPNVQPQGWSFSGYCTIS